MPVNPAWLSLAFRQHHRMRHSRRLMSLSSPCRINSSAVSAMIWSPNSGAVPWSWGWTRRRGYAGVLTEREGISYFISHPGHPPLFGEETDIEAQRDWFGGVKAKQPIVCSLHLGPEKDYAKGEAIARVIFAPVSRAHRVTTEQMALLEPALVETLALTCFMVIREAMEEIIRMGVPQQAAFDFLMGHIRTTVAIVFDYAGAPVSDGAKLAATQAREQIFQPDWKKILKIENVKQSVKDITGAI